MDRISKIIYINLERRQDRRQEIEQELQMYGLSGERFNAISNASGIVGCGLSHLAVLEEAEKMQWENVLILEDDFQFLVTKETLCQQFQAFWDLNIPWDVVMISYNLKESAPYNNLIGRVKNASTASGYLINRHFYPQLIHVLKISLPLLESTGMHWLYANDQCWKDLQLTAEWFYFMNRIGRQRGSFSDTANAYIDRGD